MKQHPPESLRASVQPPEAAALQGRASLRRQAWSRGLQPPLSASPGRRTQPARRGGPCAAARAWSAPVSCRVFLAVLLAALLAACGNQPPVPDWQQNAHGAAERASAAYLAGNDRVAAQEWQRARAELARTGRPDALAQLELLRCAAQATSLVAAPCSAFDALRADATAAQLAYADYLAGRATPEQAALLPAAQRAAATSAQAVAGIEDPLSRLVAAGAALRAGRATEATADLAISTASQQGWRRPLLAWLLLRAAQAQAAGDTVLAAALQRRIALIESGGAPAAQAPKN